MATKPLPSQEVLRQLLDYDPETGALTWRERDPCCFPEGKNGKAWNASKWNGRFAGKRAFTTKMASGHLSAGLFGKTRFAHRVVWKWMTGEDPKTVDHINGDPTDNRWSNLRSVSQTINSRNCKISKNNTSGANGVRLDKRRSTWVASITVDRRKKYIGEFPDYKQAVKARRAAEKAHGFHENHGRRS